MDGEGEAYLANSTEVNSVTWPVGGGRHRRVPLASCWIEVMERRTSTSSGALQGEDLTTTHAADARHWISIYADLLEFKRGLLNRVHQDLPKLRLEAREAAKVDVGLIELQMLGYKARLELWYRRVWELQGLWINPETRVINYRGREASLTNREFELMQMMLEHPHRWFATRQIVGGAWADSALSPEEARNYVRRLRKVLRDLGAPVDLVNKPGRATRWSSARTEDGFTAGLIGQILLWPLFRAAVYGETVKAAEQGLRDPDGRCARPHFQWLELMDRQSMMPAGSLPG